MRLILLVAAIRPVLYSRIVADPTGAYALTLLQLTVIALVQGITEFLPVSSSGHLILIPAFTGWQDQGLVIDVAVHVGTLGAVMVYLWRDIVVMLRGVWRPGQIRKNAGLRLIFHLFIATVPVVVVGGLVFAEAGDMLRTAEVVGWATLGFGVLLYAADRYTVTINRIEHMTWLRALAIGLAQCFALIPGASRAGVTITAARWLGFERTDAARFSMLMSIPTIMAAGAAASLKMFQEGAAPEAWDQVFTAAGLSFVSALIAIAVMMTWLRRASFTPFFWYRMALGVAILWWAYS